jgi:hypothetical protein
VQLFQELSLSAKTRGLLLVTFFTLSLTALAFLMAIYSLDRGNREIFQSVESSIERSSNSVDLYRMLVKLELEIRDLITVILREPYKLTEAKGSLKEQFELILQKAEAQRKYPGQQKLFKQLRWYRSNLDRLLEDYGALNSVLYEVYLLTNNIKEQLIYLEETAGQLMIEYAMDGRNTDSIQQIYVLISIAYEKILQVHILINSSITNYDPKLLVPTDSDMTLRDEDTVSGNIKIMVNTLRTLTAAESEIASYAVNIQEKIPPLENDIFDLAVKLQNLNEHYRLFVAERKKTQQLLEEVEESNRSSLLKTKNIIKGYSQKTRLVAWLIAFAVLFISMIGLLLVKKMSQRLEMTAKEALLAREAAEHLNKQLQREVD